MKETNQQPTGKDRLAQATEWMKSLSPQEFQKEAIKAKKICQQHKLMTMMDIQLLKQGNPNSLPLRVAQLAVVKAWLFNHREE